MKKLVALSLVIPFFAILFLSCQESEKKGLSLNPLFSDHMVLQQQEKVALWGTVSPNENITVSGSWGKEATTTSDAEGNWNAKLQTPEAGGPFEVTIGTANESKVLKDVLVGEVWLASGQSNMEMPLEGFLPNEPVNNYKEEVAAANHPNIRYFDVTRAIAPSPEKNAAGQWNVTTPETASQFSAAAYFFARKIHKELGVPVGIISSTWGGTPVESWMSRKKLSDLGEFSKELETIKEENIAVYKDWYSKFPTEAIPRSPEEWDTLELDDDGYAQPDFDTSNWGNTTMPNVVEKLSTTSNDGIFWFRKTFDLDDISSDYTFAVSAGIDDMDFLFLNGKKLGSTFGWNTPRSYTIPKSSLVEGANTIAIRVIDTGGGGGFSGNVTLTANSSGKSIPMAENWQYKQIAGIQGFNFLLFHKNLDALDNPPEGIESFNLDANTPTVLFNGMIHPLIPYAIQGAIWYQGESNVGRHEQYLKLFPGMIDDWRDRWNSDFSFYFVQIAPFEYGGGLSPALRDAQRKSLKTAKTGMAITMDIGMKESIHPGNKQDVGDRLARLALANDYSRNIMASGPLYKSHSTEGNKIVVEFENLGEGLTTDDSDLEGFEIAAADKNFVPAKALIVDGKIEVSSPSIKKPHYVRYGWKDYLEGSLFNSDGLPASSFTTE